MSTKINKRPMTDTFCLNGMVVEHVAVLHEHFNLDRGQTIIALSHKRSEEAFGTFVLRVMYRDNDGRLILEDVRASVVGQEVVESESLAKMDCGK